MIVTDDAEAGLVDARPAWPRDWRHQLLRLGLALLTVLLTANLAKLLLLAQVALGYRYDLEYGEGIVWQQMRNIVAGYGYSPLGVYPAIVYHYPPVYHVTAAALAWAGGLDQLMAGRLVSLLATLASVILVGSLTFSAIPRDEGRFARLAAAAIAGLCLASMPAILIWSNLMRVDMLGCALTLAGLALAIRAVSNPSAIPFAAVLFVLAIYTKQTSIAGPIAAFAGLWYVRPRSALWLMAGCIGLGLIPLAALSIVSHGGFLRHILLYNINRLDLSQWHLLARILVAQSILIVIAAFGVVAALKRLGPVRFKALRDTAAGGAFFGETLAGDGSKAALLILLLFLGVKTAMLPMALKSGASENYAIEWLCAIAIFVGVAAVPVLKAASYGTAWPSRVLVSLFTIVLPVSAWQMPSNDLDPAAVRLQTARMASVVADIRASPKPVISDDMVLLIRAGRGVQWEPAITAELAHSSLYGEAAFARMVRRRYFGFFITHGDKGSALFDQRYNPIVADAIESAYPRKAQVGPLVFHLPPS